MELNLNCLVIKTGNTVYSNSDDKLMVCSCTVSSKIWPCSFTEVYRRFGAIYYLHFKDELQDVCRLLVLSARSIHKYWRWRNYFFRNVFQITRRHILEGGTLRSRHLWDLCFPSVFIHCIKWTRNDVAFASLSVRMFYLRNYELIIMKFGIGDVYGTSSVFHFSLSRYNKTANSWSRVFLEKLIVA
jgi:hypothetical protein